MDFSLTEAERDLVGLCRDFAQQEIAPRAPAAWEEARCPTDLLREMGALGLLGHADPRAVGRHRHVDRRLRRRDGAARPGRPVGGRRVAGARDHRFAAAVPLRHRRAARALAATAGRGTRARCVRSDRARRRFGRAWHPHAGGAARRRLADQRPEDVHLQRRHRHVVRRDAARAHRSRPRGSRRRFASFVVEKDTPGFTMGPKMRGIGWRGLDTRELFFDDVWVADDHLVGDPAMGLGQFLRTLEVGRISIAALVAQPDPGRARPGDGVRAAARAVRPADLEVPGDPVQARRHRDRARGGALAHVSRRVPARHRAAVPQGSGDGEAEGQSPRGVGRVGGGADPRRRRLHARVAGRPLLLRREGARDRRRHQRDPAPRDRPRRSAAERQTAARRRIASAMSSRSGSHARSRSGA